MTPPSPSSRSLVPLPPSKTYTFGRCCCVTALHWISPCPVYHPLAMDASTFSVVVLSSHAHTQLPHLLPFLHPPSSHHLHEWWENRLSCRNCQLCLEMLHACTNSSLCVHQTCVVSCFSGWSLWHDAPRWPSTVIGRLASLVNSSGTLNETLVSCALCSGSGPCCMMSHPSRSDKVGLPPRLPLCADPHGHATRFRRFRHRHAVLLLQSFMVRRALLRLMS